MAGRGYVGAMTGEALCIVGIQVALDPLVGVMTRDATDATVRGIVAAAAFQAIRLETSILNSVKFQHPFLCCSPVARATEGSDPAGREMTGVKDMRVFGVSTLHGLNMLPAR